jgi:hypothetical protein
MICSADPGVAKHSQAATARKTLIRTFTVVSSQGRTARRILSMCDRVSRALLRRGPVGKRYSRAQAESSRAAIRGPFGSVHAPIPIQPRDVMGRMFECGHLNFQTRRQLATHAPRARKTESGERLRTAAERLMLPATILAKTAFKRSPHSGQHSG